MNSSLSKQEEQEIIRRVIAGESHAYRILVKQYERYVFSAAMKIVGHVEDAEDVAQEAFVKAFNHLHKFDGRSKFSTWLYRIAINTAISKRRKIKYHTQDIDKTPISSTVSNENTLKIKEQRHYLQLAFNRMKEDDVTVLTLFYLKELSLKEIAEIAEIEVNTAKVKIHRARKKLAKELQLILKQEAKTLL